MNKNLGIISFSIFSIGLVLVVIGGLVAPTNVIISMILAAFGLIIGVIYIIVAKEINTLLLATVALLAMTAAFNPITDLWSGKLVTSIILNFVALISPVALIAAIKALVTIGIEE